MDLTSRLHFSVTISANTQHFSVTQKGKIMSNPGYRTKNEWLSLIEECRKSGMTDAQWCLKNGISRNSFYSAIKRLRKDSYTIPSRQSPDIYDLTTSKQDVVKVDILSDVRLPEVTLPTATPLLDNSHMIEITMGDVHISLCNGADPVLVSKTLSLLRSYS